jgi:hypothetical protein
VLFGATGGGNPGQLYTINPSTGTATPVGALVDALANTYAVTGLAFDSVNGILYGSTSKNSPTGSQSLVAIDPTTGLVTYIGSFATGDNNTMADLTFDVATATLYGSGSLNGNLYTIDTTTGAASALGSSGLLGVVGVGMAIDSLGTIYGAPRGADQELVTYDKITGAATTVATLSGAPYPSPSNISAMAFDASDTLYGVNVDLNDVTRPTHLVTINTATGAITDIGLSVNNLDAIAFAVVPEPISTILIGVGLCFIGIKMRRHYSAGGVRS